MAQTDITAIDAKTISINGVPIAGSGAPSGPVTKFSGLDADSVLALNGNILMGALPPGGVFTKFTDLDVAGLSVHEVPFGGGSVVTLAGLAISPTTATAGTAYNGTISGATAGSTITGTPPAGLTVNSGARTITGTPTAATSTPFNLVETLAGATGSPRTSSVTLTVAAAAGPPLSSSLVASWLPGNITGLSDNADITSIPDSKNGATMAPVSSGAKAKYRTGGLNGKPYVQVAIGQVYDLDPTGTPLKTAMDSGDFTVIHFLHNVTNTARSEVAVFSSYSNTAAVWHHATGARMGIHDLWAGGSAFFDSPYTDTGFASLAVSSTPSYPSYGIGVTQISINGGCIGSILGKQAGAVSRVSLFGIQGSPGSVYDGGSYAGNWYGTLIYNRRLTPPEIKQVTKWGYDLLGLTMPQTQLMGFSDSLLNGLDSDVPEYSPMAIAAGNLALSYGQWDNLSISGIFEDAITANISELTGLSAYAGSNPRAVVGEYYNSVTAAGVTGAQAATKTQAMVTAAKAGWSSLKIALQTAQASPRDTSNETNRTSYNNALVAGLTGVNALIRIDQNANIGTTGADTSGTYFKLSDPPHLTGTSSTSGYRTKAGLISTVVAAM